MASLGDDTAWLHLTAGQTRVFFWRCASLSEPHLFQYAHGWMAHVLGHTAVIFDETQKRADIFAPLHGGCSLDEIYLTVIFFSRSIQQHVSQWRFRRTKTALMIVVRAIVRSRLNDSIKSCIANLLKILTCSSVYKCACKTAHHGLDGASSCGGCSIPGARMAL